MSESILSRSAVSQSHFSPLQSEVDGLVGGFLTQATDWRALAAMTAGGGAYRLGRMGVIGSGVLESSPTLARVASVAAGLGGEVMAFEGTHRSLLQATGDTHNPNLFRWEGRGGLRQGLLSSTVTFGALRGAGALAEGQNLLTRHLLQDTAMVAGHNVTGLLGISERPQGSLAQQFLTAEATNLQMEAGFSLIHRLAPGLPALERGLDVALSGSSPRSSASEGEGLHPALALATAGSSGKIREGERPVLDHILMMVKGNRDEAPASSQRPTEGLRTETHSVPPPRSRTDMMRDLGQILTAISDSIEHDAPGSERMRVALAELKQMAQEHPEVLHEIDSVIDTIRRYPEISESLEPVLRILNQEGRSTKSALGAAQRELQKIINEHPEIREQAQNFMRLKHLVPNGLTLAATVMAVLSCLSSMHGEPGTAAKLLIAAAIIDKADGLVARAMRATHEMGAKLDSYADFANYGIASALFTYSVLNQHGESAMGTAAALIIGSLATLRLATFDYLDAHPQAMPTRDILRNPVLGQGKDFMGMPSTMMGLILPALYWVFGRNHPDIFYGLSTMAGIAMYSPLRYGKLTDGILGGIGRRVLQTIRNPAKVAVGGAATAILSYLGYRFPEVSLPLAQVGVLGGLGFYVGSPFMEAFSRLFAGGNSNGNGTPNPPPVLPGPKIDEGALPSLPPTSDEGVAGRTPIPGGRKEE